jgi:hypothetical protein
MATGAITLARFLATTGRFGKDSEDPLPQRDAGDRGKCQPVPERVDRDCPIGSEDSNVEQV